MVKEIPLDRMRKWAETNTARVVRSPLGEMSGVDFDESWRVGKGWPHRVGETGRSGDDAAAHAACEAKAKRDATRQTIQIGLERQTAMAKQIGLKRLTELQRSTVLLK